MIYYIKILVSAALGQYNISHKYVFKLAGLHNNLKSMQNNLAATIFLTSIKRGSVEILCCAGSKVSNVSNYCRKKKKD